MLKFLQGDDEVAASGRFLKDQNYFTNIHCEWKNWDLANVVPVLKGSILDMGCLNSFILENAIARKIIGKKVGVELADVSPLEGATILKRDMTDTRLPDGSFDTITCLSTIEHGVDIEVFLTEAARLLKPGGRLYITFDYHDPKIDTSGIIMFGVPWTIFCRHDVEQLIKIGASKGLKLTGDLNWSTRDHIVHYGPIRYTFGILVLEKTSGYDILIVNSEKPHCGVHQFGLNTSRALQSVEATSPFRFRRVECASEEDVRKAFEEQWPSAVVFNYAPSMMPWLNPKLITELHVPTIGIYHEITQEIANKLTNDPSPFQEWICGDPTLIASKHIIPGGRPLPVYKKTAPPSPSIPTVGTFGFGSYFKGHQHLVKMVADQFSSAIIRIHVPYGYPDPRYGDVPATMLAQMRAIAPSHIQIQATHDFMETPKLLDWLAENSINVFLYEDTGSRGISSATDYAMAVPRPIAITRCNMFRHILGAHPSILVEERSLPQIIADGAVPLDRYREAFSPTNLLDAYTKVLKKVLT